MLVEGDAEYILMGALYAKATARTLEEDGVHIISVGGTSFKRYMELARTLEIRTAVVRDNDKDYQANCVGLYAEHISDCISVFADRDNARYTFEVCIFAENEDICNQLFSVGGIQKAPQEYMIDNKAESALRLLDNHADDLIVPAYIQEAIEWINA
ncbi:MULTISPECIES: TOPRIM nucleotidyl transferase/hydrolase domain-containing protein [unclassified Alteromonas]|uniref:TOPRIM nucleotidyl transferase/hydrolase domain-containing protein n=1 Tax=unclassified Alteromonas TaxID=2614992 RepID=UPI00300D12AA